MREKINLLLILIFASGIFFIYHFSKEEESGPLDQLAQCIEESGTKFYGAHWDIPTREQLKEFGPSKRLLPYIECADGGESFQFQSERCSEAGIETYPTWAFPDGGYYLGVLTPEQLEEKTRCWQEI